ncbi:hypothetical protein THITH_07730 [Thioalkalivibrio paradoxus ARh 1]|uniref:Uncharacterized protein n=1 Tax=Thioalkalivibrio paradoxus ARh 1 TaxID=713585 RepID=W0DNK8_9GAMM|nr:hypothetical protein THITH_07730 [Thioalkalivibrio paradoxus ARh 1]
MCLGFLVDERFDLLHNLVEGDCFAPGERGLRLLDALASAKPGWRYIA